MPRLSAIDAAIKTSGGISVLARLLDVSKQRVWNWKHRQRVPVNFVWDVSRVSGVAIERFYPKRGRK